jgi:ABC-type antimicrobial peptide transport system permease subunit
MISLTIATLISILIVIVLLEFREISLFKSTGFHDNQIKKGDNHERKKGGKYE